MDNELVAAAGQPPADALAHPRPAGAGPARHQGGETVVILGAGDVGQLLARKLLRHPEYGMSVVGFVDSAPKQRRADVTAVPVLGRIDDLVEIVQRLAVDRVIVAFSHVRDDELLERARALLDLR